MSDRVRTIAGCMTGTSLDGLDVALTQVRGSGLDMTAHFVGMVSLSLGELADQLRHFAEGNAAPPLDYLQAARQLGELHADAVAQVCDEHLPSDTKLDFVVAHGQTIWHAPGAGEKTEKQKNRKAGNKARADDDRRHQHCHAGVSWQLFDPWPLVKRMNVPVCYDLRQADLIAGGQGAPITPIADWVMYDDRADTVINLGGIMNISYIMDSPEMIVAGDLGPCNILLDGLCDRLFNRRYDVDGQIAAQGEEDLSVYFIVYDEIFDKGLGQSLGREQFNDAWLDELLTKLLDVAKPHDILRGAILAVAQLPTGPIDSYNGKTVVVAGGGAKNRTLVEAIQKRITGKEQVILSDDLGIPCEAREAMGFAVLGALSQDGVPITLPQVTGAKGPGVAGVWAGI